MLTPGREHWMRLAVERARAGIALGQSPFGTVIVHGGQLVGAGHNEVWKRTDPTAHAEVVALQRAGSSLGTIDLSDCELYSTCEPCPMCASAIHWAKISRVYYGATIEDAESAGFSELAVPIEKLYEMGGSPVQVVSGVLEAECRELFAAWKKSAAARAY